MDSTPTIDRVFEEIKAVRSLVEQAESGSDLVSYDALSSKIIIVSSASYFEGVIVRLILELSAEMGAHAVVISFIHRQGLDKKFHQLFSWKEKSMNNFFKLFGEAAKKHLIEKSRQSDIEQAIQDFLYIGQQRNYLVHNNFAGHSLDCTPDEAWTRHKSAARFTGWLKSTLTDYCRDSKSKDS